MSVPHLFQPFTLRGVTIPNRIGVSPMCQYSAVDGVANDWHLAHLGTRAAGGAGLVFVEATAVAPEGRISLGCTGLWNDAQIEPMARIARFVQGQGAIAGIQIGHAGRKASTQVPWEGRNALSVEEGSWPTVAPSALPFDPRWPVPRALTIDEIRQYVESFALAAKRALAAGFQVLELHGAHGYLINQFLSPLTNQRDDIYGGSFENRTRFLREVIAAVRQVWPEQFPLFLRISASDWADGGWTVEDSVALALIVKTLGVDLIDCSSGGVVSHAKMQVGPGYQVPFADAVRRGAGIATAAVGMITEPQQAEEIISSGQADIVLLARELLRNPYWPIHAARALGGAVRIPNQYARAF